MIVFTYDQAISGYQIMTIKKLDLKYRKYLLILIFLSLIIFVVPTIEPYEGSQTEIKSINKFSDWWDLSSPLVPFIFSVNSKIEWIIFYSFLLFLILKSFIKFFEFEALTKIQFLGFLGLFYLSSIFSIIGGRDGIAFALIFYALSNLYKLNRNKNYIMIVTINSLILFIAANYKIAAVPFIGIGLFVITHLHKNIFFTSLKFVFFVLIIPVLVIEVRNELGKILEIPRTYPEQQIMFYDLAGAYCWTTDPKVREFSSKALLNFTNTGYISETFCSNLKPYGWDSLHSTLGSSVENNLLVQKIKSGEYSKFNRLNNYWVNYIMRYPKSYAEIRSNFLGQILSMNNAFKRGEPLLYLSTNSITQSIRSVLLLPAKILDYFLITTYFFAIAFLALRVFGLKKYVAPYLVLFLGLVVNLFSFVADNGRYVVSYLLLFWILLLVDQINNKSRVMNDTD